MRGVQALAKQNVGAVLASRPIHSGGRLANEAFMLVSGKYVTYHRKHIFPEEPGWNEGTWFQNGMLGFDVHEVCGVRIAFQLGHLPLRCAWPTMPAQQLSSQAKEGTACTRGLNVEQVDQKMRPGSAIRLLLSGFSKERFLWAHGFSIPEVIARFGP